MKIEKRSSVIYNINMHPMLHSMLTVVVLNHFINCFCKLKNVVH